jgi:hypothetical protein
VQPKKATLHIRYTKQPLYYICAKSKYIGDRNMKSLIFSSLLGLALVAFTGCTNGSDAGASKCQSGKCSGDKKSSDAKKCQANGKCSSGY